MNPLSAFLALRALPLAQRQLLIAAAVVAVALLSMYVQLLHSSLARGDELREMQRAASATKAGKPAATRPQAGQVRARSVADGTTTETRTR